MSGKTYGTGVQEVRERLRQLALYRDAVGGDDPLLDFYVKVTAKVLDCERCSIFIRDRQTGKVFLKSGTGLKERDIVVDVDTSVVGKVIETGEPIIMEGMHQRDGVHKSIDAKTGFTTRNILCIPVYSLNSKRVVGAVQVLNKVDGTQFNEDDQAVLTELARFLQLSLETGLANQQAQRAMRNLTNYLIGAALLAAVFGAGWFLAVMSK
jgi:GAF domain-containing protein